MILQAGDLNTTNIQKIAEIAMSVFTLAREPVHPFLFSAVAPRTLPTSVTAIRQVRIDYLLLQPSLVEVVEADRLPRLETSDPIPNADHPSDHVPVVMTLKLKRQMFALYSYATEWVKGILQADVLGPIIPLSVSDLQLAFECFDETGDNEIGIASLQQRLSDLGFFGQTKTILGIIGEELMSTRDKQVLGRVSETGEVVGASGKWAAEQVLTIDDFCLVYIRCLDYRLNKASASIFEAFSYFDTDKSGTLTHDELRTTFTDACPFHVSDRHRH